MRGTVTNILFHKGFAFILGQDSRTYFAHAVEFTDRRQFDFLALGDKVQFEFQEEAKGPRALKIVKAA